jgi:hypothetical protein
MPRGNPKRAVLIRLDPALVEKVRGHSTNLTEAIEQGLELWLKRAKREEHAKAKQQQKAA